MAKGSTVSAKELTNEDRKALEICKVISESIAKLIKSDEQRELFIKTYAKISFTRDGGSGRSAGKLQRDALCTRGRTDKAPFSNRNLRWHPLIAANKTPYYAKEVDSISIYKGKLVFSIGNQRITPEDTYKIKGVYCAPLEKWIKLKDKLKEWGDKEWTANSCIIPAMEYSPINFSIEVFATLAIAVASSFYSVDISEAYKTIIEVFSKNKHTLSSFFPDKDKIKEIVYCPLCHTLISEPPGNLDLKKRDDTFQSPWRPSKRGEGKAESIQLFHSLPLVESEIRHRPDLVFYGHRWCNVAVGDHSIDETLEFMKKVLDAHASGK